MDRKQWVIPDIHGHINTLRALIEQQIQPSKHDWLYFLGDYIDRGPDPKSVVDYLMHLQEEEYNVRFLKGNHEDYLLRLYNNERIPRKFLGIPLGDELKKEWYKYGGKNTLASFKTNDVKKIPEKYIQWFQSLETYIELDSFILVHAGINFLANDPMTDTHSMMWIQEFTVKPEKIGGKRIIHGHVPVSLEFINMVINSAAFGFIDLDNGIYVNDKEGFGNMVALELNSMQLAVQANADIE